MTRLLTVREQRGLCAATVAQSEEGIAGEVRFEDLAVRVAITATRTVHFGAVEDEWPLFSAEYSRKQLSATGEEPAGDEEFRSLAVLRPIYQRVINELPLLWLEADRRYWDAEVEKLRGRRQADQLPLWRAARCWQQAVYAEDPERSLMTELLTNGFEGTRVELARIARCTLYGDSEAERPAEDVER